MEELEIYWEVSSSVYFLLNRLLIGYWLYRFARPFMEHERSAVYASMAYFATIQVLYMIPSELNNFTVYGTGTLISFLVMCRQDRRNYQQKIFISTAFFSLRWLSAYMANIIFQRLYMLFIYHSYMIERPVLQLIAYGVMEMLNLFLWSGILKISVSAIIKAYIYKREELTIKEMLILTMPCAAQMLEYGILLYYRNFIETDSGENPLIYDVLTFLHYGISIFIIVIMTVLFQNIKARQDEKLQNELLAMQVDNVKKHIEQVEGLYRNIRSLRHDMANHILTLERLYTAEKTDEALAYSRDLQEALSQITGEIKSGNPVTDVILQEWKQEAEKKKIHFQSEFYYPVDSNINAFDISVILNNALQNAVENTENNAKGYISVLSWRRKNVYMIEIKNSFTKTLQWDEQNGFPLTSKEQTNGHGYGLGNIRRIAEKYTGDMDIILKDKEFCLSIMLIIE